MSTPPATFADSLLPERVCRFETDDATWIAAIERSRLEQFAELADL